VRADRALLLIAIVGPRYENLSKGYASRFLSFESGARIEVMKTLTLNPVPLEPGAQRLLRERSARS